MIFEDGRQRRDFVHVRDLARGRYRAGDIRHCFAELGAWLEGQRTEDRTGTADEELRRRGLVA